MLGLTHRAGLTVLAVMLFSIAYAAATPPEEILADWCAQDGLDKGKVLSNEARRIIGELGDAAQALKARAEGLSMPDDAGWAGLYAEACELRRGARLKEMCGKFPAMVFTKHYDLGGSHYAYTEGQSDAQNERHFIPGASLCVLRMDGLYGTVETLLDDPTGVIRDPDVSPDGRRILFSWKKSLNEDDYHLYEMNASDRSVRQITSGLGFADYEGVYLPNGDLLFNSTRCVQTVDCWWTEVSNLYTCAADGRFLRRVSRDQVHTNYPTVTPDGRVIYTRWDYNDRGQIYPQGLFQMHPDGTFQTECYGNNSWFPTSILHARAIPGTGRIVAIFSGHHSKQQGWLGMLDPGRGRQENSGALLIAPVRPTEAARIDAYGQTGDQFQYPYPVNWKELIVGFKPEGSTAPFRIYWMDKDGHRELLAWDPAISCNQPVPLVARAVPHERPSLVDHTKDSGVFYIQDVYQGPGLAGIARGTVKKVRVVALDYRAAGVGYNTNKGPAGGALISTPVSIEGTWDVKTVLGTATVHEDGSACFTVPAKTPVYFQLLDDNGDAVQTMRSWSQLQPGEHLACVGCHESKNAAPPPYARPMALRSGPQELAPGPVPPRGFSFEREIQPILDRHCIRCHNVPSPDRMVNAAGPIPIDTPGAAVTPNAGSRSFAKKEVAAEVKPAFSLLGGPGTWSPAYCALANRRVTNWINIQDVPAMLPPYAAGAAKSPLMAMLRAGHNETALSREELETIACWIDLLVPCFGDYTEGLTGDGLAFYNKFLAKRQAWQRVEENNVREMTGAK
jgi:hypothetical protein